MADRLPVSGVRERVVELCNRLDCMAAAMAAADADALLAVEQPLAHALEELRAAIADTPAPTAGSIPVATILRAKAALRHCERLGLSLAAVSGIPMHVSGAYGRDGGYVRAASRPALDVVT
jgi:hypothetical protein